MQCKNCGSQEFKEKSSGVFECVRCFTIQTVPQPSEKHQESSEVSQIKKISLESIQGSLVRLKTEHGMATGFFVHEDGFVLTNAHVVADQVILEGFIGDSTVVSEFERYATGETLNLDLALIQYLGDAPFDVIPISQTDPELGETVMTIGNPKNLGLSVAKGTLSRKAAQEFQLDISVNPGNSGGPVLNETGEVIGVISYLLEDLKGIGFAIARSAVYQFLDNALKSKEGK